ncbi:MAG TPA: DciA family protein [Methyloceanibacter sp.]|nr:DciA family protein [Methyloceanibacter sp.]
MDHSERKALARAATTARPIGAYAGRALDPAARARGFASTSILSEWAAIVGEELANFTMPDRVVWPRRREERQTAPQNGRRGQGAVLVLRVEGPRAIEVQHRSGQILERVNAYFGYRAVVEMRILQAPVARKPMRSPLPAPPFDPGALPPSAAIEDEGLRAALLRLGSAARARLTRA